MSGTSPRIPSPSCRSRQIALVSSHLGRWPHRRRDWFAALATACGGLVPTGSTLLTVAGTTTAPYLQRCAELFSHRVEPRDTGNVARTDRDRLTVLDADTVIVLAARSRSRTESLIREILENPPGRCPSVWFAHNTSLIPDRIADSWESLGARPFEAPARDPVVPPATLATDRPTSLQDLDSEDWLVHCTRECAGPWPGQPRDEYLDDLILGRDSADHSVQRTLRRILIENRLRAVTRPIRNAPPAVSFTACPLEQLATRRTFRVHRGRWDFEPYGLAISRAWLIARGARPVVYRSPRDLVGDDPFEQPALSRGSGRFDWTAEQEWRHPGDVDLRQLPPECGLVLLGHEDDVQVVAGHGHWPVVVVGRIRQDPSAIQ